ncbi:MAG: DUF3786 domain-containing protein [Faecousia sp.]
MERRDNYAITVQRAKALFLKYDQAALARKLGAKMDDAYFYTVFLSELYRIHRRTGDISRLHGDAWIGANSFGEVLTLLDLVCDSREDRHPSGNWKNMGDFGRGFHQSLLEQRDSWAERFQEQPERFARACESLGGEKYPLGDAAYSIPVFEDLRLLLQLWFGDEEFPAQLRYLWDENALMYLKYETMFYAASLVLNRIQERDFLRKGC